MSREFSKVYRNVWKSRKFRRLTNDDARLCYLYLLTNPHANSAGCYDMPEGYATADLEWSSERYHKAQLSLIEVGLIAFDEADETVLITNWVKFNEPTNGRHAAGMLAQLDEVSSLKLKLQRFQEFAEVIKAKRHDQDKLSGHLVKAHFARFAEAQSSLVAPRPRPETKTETESQTETETKTENVLSSEPREAQAVSPAPLAPDGAALTSRPQETGDYRLTPKIANGGH
jgi:hypothetical protein